MRVNFNCEDDAERCEGTALLRKQTLQGQCRDNSCSRFTAATRKLLKESSHDSFTFSSTTINY